MRYRKGYKYQLAETEVFQTSIHPKAGIITDFIDLSVSGILTVKKGYAWDGPSGPVIDRKTNMRASLAHDALYQLCRRGHLPHRLWRDIDREYSKILKQDGTWKITRKIHMAGLKIAGGKHARPRARRKVYEAP